MPDVLVRDLAAEALVTLKKRASENGRSFQAQLKIILENAAGTPEPLSDLETARKIKASLKVRFQPDSVELIREDRGR